MAVNEAIQRFVRSHQEFLHNSCDVREISTALHAQSVIDDNILERIKHSPTRTTANDELYMCLHSDPNEEKLEKLFQCLKKDGLLSHRQLAQNIKTFLEATLQS